MSPPGERDAAVRSGHRAGWAQSLRSLAGHLQLLAGLSQGRLRLEQFLESLSGRLPPQIGLKSLQGDHEVGRLLDLLADLGLVVERQGVFVDAISQPVVALEVLIVDSGIQPTLLLHALEQVAPLVDRSRLAGILALV